ncbi:hypothetical protein CCACVL1_15372 [Corchorus capsularis]|uniref:F-box domain-containing protein n=1 Tax=Corchorus capsularis TaxID=210143 RepID=A0A1R3I2W5_COCAP|nr:hypothetical protein CCACVL1_15372 [Corchorus capsularis]
MEKKVDRISSLPDPLLENVLFKLPIKEAARTGILSKSWKGLWVPHPYISLSDNDLIDDDPDNWSIRNNKFIKIVDKLLLRRHENARIKKLQLSCRQGVEDAVFSRWYGAVLKDGLEELDFNFGRCCEKPLSFLTPCSTLVTLKLYFGPVSGHKFPTSFDFPSLKNMHLNGFMLANNFPEQLLKCQDLENLFLACFMFDNCFSTDQEQVELDQRQVLPNLNHAQIGCCDYSFRGRNDARLFLKNLITVLSNAKSFDLSLSIIEVIN